VGLAVPCECFPRSTESCTTPFLFEDLSRLKIILFAFFFLVFPGRYVKVQLRFHRGAVGLLLPPCAIPLFGRSRMLFSPFCSQVWSPMKLACSFSIVPFFSSPSGCLGSGFITISQLRSTFLPTRHAKLIPLSPLYKKFPLKFFCPPLEHQPPGGDGASTFSPREPRALPLFSLDILLPLTL